MGLYVQHNFSGMVLLSSGQQRKYMLSVDCKPLHILWPQGRECAVNPAVLCKQAGTYMEIFTSLIVLSSCQRLRFSRQSQLSEAMRIKL